MADSETFIDNKTSIATVERYDVRELARSFMMHKIGKLTISDHGNYI